MKNFLLIIATSFILFSCSKNDDDIQNVTTSFFNINTGNKWVYNRYAINTLGSTSSIIQIDSVLVIGDTLINSISYKKIEHKEFTVNSNNLLQTYYEYLRIDSNHLVVYFLFRVNELFKYSRASYAVALYLGSGFSNIRMNTLRVSDMFASAGRVIGLIRDFGGSTPLNGAL